MNNKTHPRINLPRFPSLPIGIALLLLFATTGCVNITSKHTIQPILDAVNHANNSPRETELSAGPDAAFRASTGPNLTPVIAASTEVRNDLHQAGLDKLSAVNKILKSATNAGPVKINSHELKQLARTLLDKLDSNTFNGTLRKGRKWRQHADALDRASSESERITLLAAEHKPDPDVFSLIEAYYVAYSKGQFTLRDGTVLGKPTGNFGLTNGTFKGAIPNDTVDGIVTIFTEAVSDSLFRTPLYYAKTSTTSLTNFPVSASVIYPSLPKDFSNSYIQLSGYSTNTANDFFLDGKTPTASRFLPCYQVVIADSNNKKHQKGLTQKEVQFIQAVSGLTAKQSQALAGLILRSFGGGSAGQFVFLHVSVGNNQVLTSIADNLMSSLSYHLSERLLNEAFIKYAGGDPDVEALLDHYQDLLKIISK